MTLRVTPRMLYRMNKGLYLKNISGLVHAAMRGGQKEHAQLLAMVQTDKEVVTSLVALLRQQDRQILDLQNVSRQQSRILFDAATLRNTAEAKADEAEQALTTNELFWVVCVFCAALLAWTFGIFVGIGL